MMIVPCEVYSRIVGYMRPVQQWNKGKQAEFRDRMTYNVNNFLEAKNDEEETENSSCSRCGGDEG